MSAWYRVVHNVFKWTNVYSIVILRAHWLSTTNTSTTMPSWVFIVVLQWSRCFAWCQSVKKTNNKSLKGSYSLKVYKGIKHKLKYLCHRWNRLKINSLNVLINPNSLENKGSWRILKDFYCSLTMLRELGLKHWCASASYTCSYSWYD